MGWLFSCDRRHGKQQLVEELRSEHRFGTRQRLIHSSVVGNNHWYVAEIVETGERYIGLDLMKSGYPDHGWGYKDLTASMGPVEVNCPLTLLKLAPDGGGRYETEWRERVLKHHALKRAERARGTCLTAGSVIKYAGRQFRLMEPITLRGRRGGWKVEEWDTGAQGYTTEYRMSLRQVAQSEVV